MKDSTHIWVEWSVANKLRSIGRKGESYNDVLKRVLKIAK